MLAICGLIIAGSVNAESRFPHPDFESGYVSPITTEPMPENAAVEYLDTLVLLGTLILASWLVLKRRSRNEIYALMIFSLIYFGFWRKGCICPVGSIQNVVMALTNPSYALPVTVLAFFLLPLIFSLFFGRTFCAAVCPLGAIQDAVILKPIELPWAVSRTLRLIPYIYLGAAVLLTATGSAFIICRLDPFVALFRLNGEFSMMMLAALFLLIGIFIARPYCRFFCPYGVLLNWASRFSRWHMTITPGECVQCRLCEDSCPFDAIRKPVPTKSPEAKEKAHRRLLFILALLPLLVLVTGFAGSRLHIPLSKLDNTVILAEQIRLEEQVPTTETTLQSDAFREAGKPVEELYADAENLRKRMHTGGWLFGCFIGMAIGCSLITFSVRRTRNDYEPDRAECLSCGRCFAYCPVKKEPKVDINEK